MPSLALQIAQDTRGAQAVITSQGSFKLVCQWTVRQVKLAGLHDWWCTFPAVSWEMKTSLGEISELMVLTHGIWSRPCPEVRQPNWQNLSCNVSRVQMLQLWHVIVWQGWFSTLSRYFTTDCINDTASWSEFRLNGFHLLQMVIQLQGLALEKISSSIRSGK